MNRWRVEDEIAIKGRNRTPSSYLLPLDFGDTGCGDGAVFGEYASLLAALVTRCAEDPVLGQSQQHFSVQVTQVLPSKVLLESAMSSGKGLVLEMNNEANSWQNSVNKRKQGDFFFPGYTHTHTHRRGTYV